LIITRKVAVKKITYEVPNLYGDHHVVEVRKILFEIPGVIDVYASSAFRMVEVTYDPTKTNDLDIAIKLDQAGYLGEWSVPMEAGASTYLEDRSHSYFRHTAVYETTRQVVSFAQNVSYSGRPLWNCPGMGVIKNRMEE
jgi:copper chaperone CopZ